MTLRQNSRQTLGHQLMVQEASSGDVSKIGVEVALQLLVVLAVSDGGH